MMHSLSSAIQKTISYAAFFDYPLSPEEIHYWLITSHPVSFKKIQPLLPHSLSKLEQIKRHNLSSLAQSKITSTKSFVNLLSLFPSIKFIAITGSLAVHNSKAGDDVDLMIVTSPHTLWLTRLLVILLLTLFGRRRYPKSSPQAVKNTFCLNLWLDENSLLVPSFKHNLYTAHEVLQILPLYDSSHYYTRFLLANSWVKKYLSNAYHSLTQKHSVENHPPKLFLVLSIFLSPLNYLAYLLQLNYMKKKITHETITLNHAYFHPRSFYKQIQKHLSK